MRKKKNQIAEFIDVAHQRLRTSKSAFDYLKDVRGFTVETITREKIGFCDDVMATDFLSSLDDDRWVHGTDYYRDMMRGRVVLPIRDDMGRVVAFSTKVPERGSKGWWNSPFSKENVLYGLNFARRRAFSKNKIYVLEGYADVISMWQAGVHNAVGMMGTTVTPVQHGLILRYCNNVCACFDTDIVAPGKKGGGQLGLERFVAYCDLNMFYDRVSAVVLPPVIGDDGSEKSNDPDDFIRKNGINDFLGIEKGIILHYN